MRLSNDPIGLAIQDYCTGYKSGEILVESDLCDDDIIPVKHFFRTFNEMNAIEQKALALCSGKILDVGAAAGCHLKYLKNNHEVVGIEISKGAILHLQEENINCIEGNILDYNQHKFDTILLLMNGLGIAGSIIKLPSFLVHLKSLLNDHGKIICDSTDIRYLYQNEDGSFDINLNANYYGEMQFRMSYKNQQTNWFDWLYIDYDNLEDIAEKAGLKCQLILAEDYHFLVEIQKL